MVQRVLSQLSDLQQEKADLGDRVAAGQVETARLTRQLEEARSANPAQAGAGSLSGAVGGENNFAVLVQPIIEEYERAIEGLESELKLTKAALVRGLDH